MDNNMNNTQMNDYTVETPVGNGKMREHYTRLWAFMGVPGFIVACCAGNREEEMTKQYLNQAAGYMIVAGGVSLLSILFYIPYLGWLLALLCIIPLIALAVYDIVVFIQAIIHAVHDTPVNFFIYNKFRFFK